MGDHLLEKENWELEDLRVKLALFMDWHFSCLEEIQFFFDLMGKGCIEAGADGIGVRVAVVILV